MRFKWCTQRNRRLTPRTAQPNKANVANLANTEEPVCTAAVRSPFTLTRSIRQKTAVYRARSRAESFAPDDLRLPSEGRSDAPRRLEFRRARTHLLHSPQCRHLRSGCCGNRRGTGSLQPTDRGRTLCCGAFPERVSNADTTRTAAYDRRTSATDPRRRNNSVGVPSRTKTNRSGRSFGDRTNSGRKSYRRKAAPRRSIAITRFPREHADAGNQDRQRV